LNSLEHIYYFELALWKNKIFSPLIKITIVKRIYLIIIENIVSYQLLLLLCVCSRCGQWRIYSTIFHFFWILLSEVS